MLENATMRCAVTIATAIDPDCIVLYRYVVVNQRGWGGRGWAAGPYSCGFTFTHKTNKQEM